MSAAFDHRDPGTPAAAWPPDRLAALPVLPAPAAGDRVVVLAAHPDDETLGAGALVHAARAAGAAVRVVVATDGEGSHPHSPTHSPDRLAARRRAELAAAVAELGDGIEVHRLGRPDGGLAVAEPELARVVAPHLMGATHVVAPWRHDGHPDHEALGRVAAAGAAAVGARCWEYPVWLWHWAAPDAPGVPWLLLARRPADPAARAAKARALAHYVSQHAPLSEAPGDEAIVPARVSEHFARADELFVVAEPRLRPAAPHRRGGGV